MPASEPSMLLSHASQDDPSAITEGVHWLAIERIIHSDAFRRSSRMPQLLRYLARESLLNRSHHLTERAVAIHIFGRGEDFDPAIDTIVRSQMVRLRQKLDQYTAENENRDSIRIAIPKGDYVVRFEPNPRHKDGYLGTVESVSPDKILATHLADRAAIPPEQIASEASRQKLSPWLPTALLAVALLCSLIALSYFIRKAAPFTVLKANHPLWSALFQENRPTLSISADSGLVMLESLAGKEITLGEYLNHDFSRLMRGLPPDKAELALNLGRRRYTAFTDVATVNTFSDIAAQYHSSLSVKYARDLTINDLKHGNIILGGAHLSTPWLELFEPNMDFVGVNDFERKEFRFENKHPHGGESNSYSISWKDTNQRTLGLVAFLPGLDKKSNVLIIEGSNMPGAEAVDDFLLDDKALKPFLDSICRSDGTLPYFEMILESTSVNGNAGSFRIAAYHTHPRS